MSSKQSKTWLGVAAISGTMSIYVANFVACRYSLQNGFTSLDLVALRFTVAGILLLPYFCIQGVKDLGGIGWGKGIVLATLAGVPYMCLFYGGLRLAPASHGAVLNPGIVPSVVFVCMVVLGLQSFSLSKVFALAIIILGLILVTGSSFVARGDVLIGDALMFTTGLFWGVFTLLARLWRLRPFQSAAIVAVLSLFFLPFYLVFCFHGFESVTLTHLAAQAVFQGVGNSILAICLVTYAIHALGPQMTSLFSPSVPVLTTLVAIPLLGEVPNATQALGVLIVAGGMVTAAVLNYRQSTEVARRRVEKPI